MFKKRNKRTIIFLSLIILTVFLFPQTSLLSQAEQNSALEEARDKLGETAGQAGLPETELMTVISNVIQWLLGFLGLIAAILIIVGGFQWMTSGGQEEKIAKAKKLMTNGIIGLVIILLAYILTNFIITQLEEEIFTPGSGGESVPGND